MKIVHVSIGSIFEYKGQEYTLVETGDGGLQWMGKDGFHKLTQRCYYYPPISPLKIEKMAKLLPMGG